MRGTEKMIRLDKVVAFFAVAAACSSAFYVGKASKQWGEAKGELVVPQAYLDFGEVWEDDSFHWTLPLENRSSQAVDVMGFASSCTCASIEPKSLIIPSGQTAEIRLTINLAAESHEQVGGTKRDFALQISPRIRNKLSTHRGWTLHGKVLRVLAISANSIQFGETLVKGQSFASRQVTIASLVPV